MNLGNVDEVTEYGHVWSLKTNPTIQDSKTSLGSTQSIGTYTSTMASLQPNRTYHVRAYAINSIGTAYGKDVEFTTVLGNLILKTSLATSITYNSAVCGGQFVDLGGHRISECGVCYSTTMSPTISSSIVKSNSSNSEYQVTLTDLREATTYHVRAYAKTEQGDIYYGDDVSFNTADKDVQIGIDGFGPDKNWSR